MNGCFLDYDHKTKIVRYDFNKIIKKGENKFVLKVTDNCNNMTTYKAVFLYNLCSNINFCKKIFISFLTLK